VDSATGGPTYPWVTQADKMPKSQSFSWPGAKTLASSGEVKVTIQWAPTELRLAAPSYVNLRIESVASALSPGTAYGSNGYSDPWTQGPGGGSASGKHLIRVPIKRDTAVLTFPVSAGTSFDGYPTSQSVMTDVRAYVDHRTINLVRREGIQKPRSGDLIEADTLFSWFGIDDLLFNYDSYRNVTNVDAALTGGWTIHPIYGTTPYVNIAWYGDGVAAAFQPIIPAEAWSRTAEQHAFNLASNRIHDWKVTAFDLLDSSQAEVTLRWRLHYVYENFDRLSIQSLFVKQGNFIASQHLDNEFDGPLTGTIEKEETKTETSWWSVSGALGLIGKWFIEDAQVQAEYGRSHEKANSNLIGGSYSARFHPSEGAGVYQLFQGTLELHEYGKADKWDRFGNVLRQADAEFMDARNTVWCVKSFVIRDQL